MAYNSSQQELDELQAAALEACQKVEEGDMQARSSMASHLRALGRHVTQRLHRALHLGVQKALDVVVSHYQVNLKAISTGYVIPFGVDDEVAMDRADAFQLLPPTSLPRPSQTSSSRTPLRLAAPKPESSWAFEPCMFLVLMFEPRGYVMNNCLFKTL
jgi:hypothetical protein